MLYPNHVLNSTITILGLASSHELATFATDQLFDLCLLKQGNGGTHGLPRYRYSKDGEKVDNITDWALKQFRAAYGKGGMSRPSISPLAGEMSAQQTEGGAMPHEQVPARLRASAKHMRKDMTEAERRLWNQIRAHRLIGLGFRRQMPIDRFVADFACPEHKLVVEVDGSHHAQPDTAFRDRERTSRLGETGWTVVRFWNHEVMKEHDDVCEHIVALVQERSANAFR